MPHSLPLDTTRIRALFPAFSEPSLAGAAHFENAGGSFTAGPVLDRLDRFYRQTKIQPYPYFDAGKSAGEAMDLAYRRLAQALGVTPDWIRFGPSTSANTYVLANALSEWLKPGDAIVVTNQDHEANSGAFRRLERFGIAIREWRVDAGTGHLDPADLDALLDESVRVVAFPHASNVVAEINPVAAIAAKVHAAGAIAIVDGVAGAPHGLPDVTALGADIYLFSAYKTFGPHQGVMVIRPELGAELPNQGHYFNADKPRYRLSPAGPDHAQIAACAGIADYLEEVARIAGAAEGDDLFAHARSAMQAQEKALLGPLLAWVADRNDLRLIGPADPDVRAPTVSLDTALPAEQIATRLAGHGIMAGAGHFFAHRLVEAVGVDPSRGLLRLSFLHYTTPDEIDRLIRALETELR